LTVYFVVIPVIQIFRIPVNPSPTTHLSLEMNVIEKRIKKFRYNQLLQTKGIEVQKLQPTREDYNRVIKILNKESEKIRRKYISQVFYRTGIIQNGFLDALLILSSSVAMVKDIFILYNGRVSNRDVWKIGKQVYYSVLIGGSEAAEYATEEVFSKFASDSLKSIPFLDKILSSIADGLINASLMTRVALITENYCTKTYVKSYREIYPSPQFITQTAKSITANIISNIGILLKRMAGEKTVDVLLKVGNPVGYIFEQAIDAAFPTELEKEESGLKKGLKTGMKFLGNPVIYGIEKWVERSRARKKLLLNPDDLAPGTPSVKRKVTAPPKTL
ncbi:MAG: hypothetical protein KFF73_15775, partial [Cyclobacteriaceae bacterium]|nr:hypothetical protein [Cyclobacteriaceae bacterium]